MFFNQGCITITFQLATELLHPKACSVSNQEKSEYYIFLNFVLKNFHGVEFKPMKDTVSKKLEKNLRIIHSIRRPLNPNRWKEEKFKMYLRAYIYFLNKNPFSERDFKTFIRSHTNVANFFRETLMIDNPTTLISTFETFFNNRFCNNAKCLRRGILKLEGVDNSEKAYPNGKERCWLDDINKHSTK